jgi:murein DD-endopeptidase MepM/ murein hydrolase activator NlpD
MKHFWMTTALGALCAFAAQAWAAPQTQYLELVAHKHHLRGSESASHSKSHSKKGSKSSRSKHHKGSKSGRGSRHGRHAESAIRSEGGGSVKVKRGDTMASIARKHGVSQEELARLNHLKRPYHIRLGEHIRLPGRRYYVVKSGDTLFSLARRFGVDQSELADANHIRKGHELQSGQRLYLPGEAVDNEAPAERPVYRRAPAPVYTPPPAFTPPPSSQPPAQQPPAQAPPASSSQGFQYAPPASSAQPNRPAIIPSAPAPSAAEVTAAGKGKFLWPVDGALIQGFGTRPDGGRNDGLNISANAGDPVRASADGQVVYAGDQVPSFGNLVLIKHEGGWVTAYAHMSKILVKNRDQVTQGQQIGVVGQTGQVDAPQLHFEIRYAASPKDKAVPVDPGLLLPQR